MEMSELLDEIFEGMPPKPDGTVEVQHFFGAGTYIRKSVVQPGGLIRMHVHEYDHLSIALGFGKLITDAGARDIKPGDVIETKAGERHAYSATTATLWYCVHPSTEEEARGLYDLH